MNAPHDLMAFLLLLQQVKQCWEKICSVRVQNQYIVINNFTASRFAGISRNCTCEGFFCVLTGDRNVYLSRLYIHSIHALYRPRILVIRGRNGRAVLLAEK